MLKQFLAVVFVSSVSASAAPVPKDFKKQDDKALLVGTWVIERANVNGMDIPSYSPAHTLIFTADGVTRFRYPDGSADQSCEWRLDTAAEPKQLAWIWKSGAEPVFNRLYTFRDGRLIVAKTRSGKTPTSLEPGFDVVVIEYKRADGK